MDNLVPIWENFASSVTRLVLAVTGGRTE